MILHFKVDWTGVGCLSPIFLLEAKRCEKVAKLGERNCEKKGLFRIFLHNSETDSQAKKLGEKKRNEAKKRLYVSEKANIIIF
jgi:hypothetical protein